MYKRQVLEIENPSAIRRKVSFCEAVFDGEYRVEDVSAVRAENRKEMEEIFSAGKIPLFVDPAGKMIDILKPSVLVDGILAKKNLGTNKNMAPITIGLGPGFYAGRDVDGLLYTSRCV